MIKMLFLTLNTYAHLRFEETNEEVKKLLLENRLKNTTFALKKGRTNTRYPTN